MPFQVAGTTVITDDRLVRLTNGSTASRPASPVAGMLFYNTQTKKVEVYDGSAWREGNSVVQPSAWGWGSNTTTDPVDSIVKSHLGISSTSTVVNSPNVIVGGITDWTQISRGSVHTLGLRANGQIWSWGANNYGEVGDGTVIFRQSPVSVVGGFTDWVQVSGRGRRSAAIRANGTLWTWGENANGQLGDNTTSSRSSPVSVVGGFTDWVQVAAASGSTAAIRANGTLWTWGGNSYGQLGDNSTSSRSSPVSVVGGFTDWMQVSFHSLTCAAIRTNGTAWAWGNNANGQLGDNTTSSRLSPVSVVGGFTDWVHVSSGTAHTMLLRASGTAWAIGAGSAGRLGTGTTSNRSSPFSVAGGITDWVQLSAGTDATMFLRANGTLWGCGNNTFQKVGSGNQTTVSSPVSVVGGITDWVQVTHSFNSTTAIRSQPRTQTRRKQNLRNTIS